MRPEAAAILLFVGVACSQATPTPIVFDEPPPFDPGPDEGGRALQERIFADGQVTFIEYEEAMVAAIGCMRDAGFEVAGPLRYPEGFIAVQPGWDPTHQLSLRASVGDDPDDHFGEVNGRCISQWSYAVEQVYLRQFAPTEAEIQEWLERAWDCLRENGHPLAEQLTEEEAMGAVSLGCRPWEESG